MNVSIRIIAALTALLAVIALAACGTETDAGAPADSTLPPPVQTTDAPEPADSAPPAVYGFTAGEAFLYPGADPALLAALGEPQDKLEAKSCVHEGYDRVYYYAGFEVNTQPTADGREVIVSVYLTDDSVTTAEGIRIGDTTDAVKSAYGEAGAEAGVYTYTKTDGGVATKVNFIVDAEGYVTSIYYN